ncbi:MAG: universal stress protein [Chitinophagaceae bacterium]|nr:universal stress protein [Chitinophagaceae bacterium]
MKKILVPTDFSACANNALNFAVQMAKLLSWNITLIHTVESDTGIYMDYMGVQREREEQMLEEAKQQLQLVKSAILETEKISIEAQISTGAVNENILSSVAKIKADLIVMGTMGSSGSVAEKLWGTKTAAIAGNSTIPVIAVPYSYSWSEPREILFATNRFEKNPALLTPLFEIARLFKSRIHAVVFTDELNAGGSDFVDNSRGLDDYKYFLAQILPAQTLVTAHISGSRFEEALQQYIEKNNIGMVAMISQQRGFLSRLVHPSATRSMAYHATIPLLIMPDQH